MRREIKRSRAQDFENLLYVINTAMGGTEGDIINFVRKMRENANGHG